MSDAESTDTWPVPSEAEKAEGRALMPSAQDKQLWEAAKDGDAAAIERLAAEGVSPNATSAVGMPAVYRAAVNGHVAAVKALVQLGADLDARDRYGQTALMGAAYNGQVECVRALLDAGADRTLRATGGSEQGKTALEIAKEGGEEGVAEMLAAADTGRRKKIIIGLSLLALLITLIGGGVYAFKGGKRRKTKRLK